MLLYDYFRSTASYRVRIALKLKGASYETVSIHLVNNGGEQHHEEYKNINPQSLVPALDVGEAVLSQSLAIIEYLDEIMPEPPLLPETPVERAEVRMLAQMIACDIHPLNNLRVLNRLRQQFSADEEAVKAWYHHWLELGFAAFEKRLEALSRKKDVCLGTDFTLADICLIPQVYNANRFEFPLDKFPLIQRINDYCLHDPAFLPDG